MEIVQPGSGSGSGGVTTITDGVHTVTSANEITFSGATVSNGGGGNAIVTITGGVTSVSNSDGTLTISPTTGAVVASIALGHANTWSGAQTFDAGVGNTTQTIVQGRSGNTNVANPPFQVLASDGTTVFDILTSSGTGGQIRLFNGGYNFSSTQFQGNSASNLGFLFNDNSASTGYRFGSATVFGFSSSSPNSNAIDTGLSRLGAASMALGNGTAGDFSGTLKLAHLNDTYTDTSTSGTIIGAQILPTYNQASGTAANTDFLINRTQTAVGSGAQNFIDAQVSGTSKFKVSNVGTITTAANGLLSIDGGNLQYALGSGVQPILALGSGTSGMSLNAGSAGSGEGGVYRFGSRVALSWAATNSGSSDEDVGLIRLSTGLIGVSNGGISGFAGSMKMTNLTVDSKISVTTGSNKSAGTGTLSGGTATISTTAVTASSLIFLTDTGGGVFANIGSLTVGTITAGTSFVVTSTNVLDSSTFNWLIIN